VRLLLTKQACNQLHLRGEQSSRRESNPRPKGGNLGCDRHTAAADTRAGDGSRTHLNSAGNRVHHHDATPARRARRPFSAHNQGVAKPKVAVDVGHWSG
jgi:hypothetical protein